MANFAFQVYRQTNLTMSDLLMLAKLIKSILPKSQKDSHLVYVRISYTTIQRGQCFLLKKIWTVEKR